jgi:oligopeptide/dipeptide ABC transporter ATP-binding protein
MTDLASRLDLTYLLITHNLNIVGFTADRIAVMYLGHVVEIGPTDDIFDHPKHPYTQALLASISEPDPRARRDGLRVLAPGEVPSPTNPPSGCRFRTRCAFATERSSEEIPQLEEVAPGHAVACHNWQEVEWPRGDRT